MTNDITDRLVEIYKAAGFKDRQIRRAISEDTGISPQAVGDWFNETTKDISTTHLRSIAVKRKVSLDYLIIGEQSAFTPSVRTDPHDEIEAISVITQQMELLDADAKARVLAWLQSKYC